MTNHYHLLLKVCPEQLEDLCDDDIMDRWCALFKAPLLIQNYRSGEEFRIICLSAQIEATFCGVPA